MKYIPLALLFLSIAIGTQAKIRLNLSIIYKKGIDKGLVLVSEYHSVEEVDETEKVRLVMKNGLTMIVFASFVQNSDDYGPSDQIKLGGSIFIRDRKLEDTFFEKEILIHLGEQKVLVYKDDSGQLIELTVAPEVR